MRVTGGNRDFALLWASDAASQLGTGVRTTVIPLIGATTLAATEFEMGLLGASGTAAFLLIGLVAGAWIDRLRRRPVLIAANIFRAAMLALIPICAVTGSLSIPVLVVLALLNGAGTVFFDVASPSLLPAVVARQELAAANGRLHATHYAGRLAGPGLGGFIAQVAGAANAIVASAVCYGGSAVALSRMRTVEPEPERPAERNLRAEIAEGLRFVLGHPILRALAGYTVSWNFMLNLGFSMHVLLLARTLDQPAVVVGLLLAAGGLGGILGSMTAARWIARVGLIRSMLIMATVGTAGAVLTPLTGAGWLLAYYVVGQLLGGYGSGVYMVAAVTCRQSACPNRLLGRVNGSLRFLSWGAIPLGLLAGGVAGELIGVYGTLWLAAAGSVLALLWIYASRLRTMRDLPAEFVVT